MCFLDLFYYTTDLLFYMHFCSLLHVQKSEVKVNFVGLYRWRMRVTVLRSFMARFGSETFSTASTISHHLCNTRKNNSCYAATAALNVFPMLLLTTVRLATVLPAPMWVYGCRPSLVRCSFDRCHSSDISTLNKECTRLVSNGSRQILVNGLFTIKLLHLIVTTWITPSRPEQTSTVPLKFDCNCRRLVIFFLVLAPGTLTYPEILNKLIFVQMS